jgi:hypothetical protein
VVLARHGYNIEDILYDDWNVIYSSDGRISTGAIDHCNKLRDNSIAVQENSGTNPNHAWRSIAALLDLGKVVPVWVDPYYLSYFTMFNHGWHVVIATGYDQASELVYIVDPSWNQRFDGGIPVTDFFESISSPYHLMHDIDRRYRWYNFDFPAKVRSDDLSFLRVRISLTVKFVLQADGKPAGYRWGLDAISAFIQTFKHGKYESDIMNSWATSFTEIGRQTYGYGDFVKSVARRGDDSELGVVGDELTSKGHDWFKAAVMIRKIAAKRDPGAFPIILDGLQRGGPHSLDSWAGGLRWTP